MSGPGTDRRPRRRPRSARRARAGFSLLEVLVAMFILLIVFLGILPMFLRSMQNNVAGREMSQAANFGRGDAEWMMQQPLDGEEFEVAAGQQQRQSAWRWVVDPSNPVTGGRWVATGGLGVPAVAPGMTQSWERVRSVRLFNVSAILPETPGIGPVAPLDGSTPAEFVHLRESVTEAFSLREQGNPLFGPMTNRPKSVEITIARAY